MTFWSYSASSKWAEDVAASVHSNLDEGNELCLSSQHCPDDRTKSPDLPAPVTQNTPSIPSLSTPMRLRKSLQHVSGTTSTTCSTMFRRVKRTLAAPSPRSVLQETLFDPCSPPADSHPQTHNLRSTVDFMQNEEEVDEIVVDRSWSEPSTKASLKSKVSVPSSESADSTTNAHQSASAGEHAGIDLKHRSLWAPLGFILYRLWPRILLFFRPRFEDRHKEETYQREDWAHSKRLALWASVFFVMNWILGAALIASPTVLADKIYYYGFAPLMTAPLFVLCAFDFPRDHATFYQCFLCISTWSWSFYQVLFGFLCGYSGRIDLFTCGSKDFLPTFYYTTALQTVALFGTNLKRFPAMLGAIVFLVLSACMIVPDRTSWTRSIVNFAIFQCFLLYMHRQREMSARRLFDLRLELQAQFERTRKAQINERKAADSKYRLTSYVFHEVRVPLNTALLAVQNMSASGTIHKSQELEFNALEGSLSMMSKVLNDVLDFNRMDSGKFESLSMPYPFHQVMRSMLIPLRLATNARNLELITNLDVNIDEVSRRAAYEASGEDHETIEQHLKEQPSGDEHWGMVVGDETRLRQIVTNLASNACKFTPTGGSLTLTTRLVVPNPSSRGNSDACDKEQSPADTNKDARPLSVENIEKHNHDAVPDDMIVVRIEVTDTGSGIRPQDMAQAKLFSAFNQTEQGGKGTGLGLALVRLIVKLSGGRLGVRSKAGQGSTFWVELPLGIGAKAISPPSDDPVVSAKPTSPLNILTHLRRDTMQSKHSMVDAVDAITLRATQASPVSLRSSHALHRLMDQGGSVELNLANYDSHSPVPTRTIGDRSTGTEIPSPAVAPGECSTCPEQHASTSLERDPDTTPTCGVSKRRPSYVALPSPSSFLFDSLPVQTPASTASMPSIYSGSQSGHRPPSPLVSKTFSPPSPSYGLSGSMMNVLVVDDDALTRTLMRRMLERMGCNVATAENGDMALKILLTQDSDAGMLESPVEPILDQSGRPQNSQSKFSIVFLDNQMPVLSGVKAIAKLRELGRQDFVVGVTGNALVTDQKEYLEAGVDHVLTKPVLERSLRSMLQLADERRKNPKESV